MTNYKLIYSVHGENKQGKLNDLLNQAKKINDIQIMLKDSRPHIAPNEEIIRFLNIMYDNDCLVGCFPFQKSSLNFTDFNSNNSTYRNYNCHLCYFSNKHYLILRYDASNYPWLSTRGLSNYEKYEWFSKDENWDLLFKSPEDCKNEDKKKSFISLLKAGHELKIKFFFNNFNYVLKPYIIHFFIDENGNEQVSAKTHPFILFGEKKEKAESFEEVEALVNSSGKTSILTNKTYDEFSNKKISIFRKIKKIINKKLVSFSPKKMKCNNTSLKIEWYIKKS